jgi:hypothetical protein
VKRILIGTIVFLGLLLQACQSPPPANRGQSGYRMDPSHDAPSELGTQAPRSADLAAATDKMAQDLAMRLDIVNADSPPRIVVGRIENNTTMPHQNYQIFVVKLRAELQAAGTRHGLEFIRERRAVEAYRDEEYAGKDYDSSADAYMSQADYMLVCEIYDLPSGGTNYFLFDYQLVQLREAATGPNKVPGAIVWENSYEVKFQ